MNELLKKSGKIEIIALAVMIVLLFLGQRAIVSPIIYLVLAVLIGLYFSPIKIMFLQKGEPEGKFHKMGTSFLISTSLILSYVMIVSPTNAGVKYFILFLFGLNLILLLLWNKNSKLRSTLYLLVLNVVLLNVAYFT